MDENNKTEIYSPGEMVRLGKLDVALRKAQALVREAYKIVEEADREHGKGLEFNATVSWDGYLSHVLRNTYEAYCATRGKDVNQYHLAHFNEFGLAEGVNISLNGLCSGPTSC